jgi:hypothetical protein
MEEKDIIITKKDGNIVLIIDNDTILLRAEINPWTLEGDIKYSEK